MRAAIAGGPYRPGPVAPDELPVDRYDQRLWLPISALLLLVVPAVVSPQRVAQPRSRPTLPMTGRQPQLAIRHDRQQPTLQAPHGCLWSCLLCFFLGSS